MVDPIGSPYRPSKGVTTASMARAPLAGVTRSNVSTVTYTTTHPCGYAAGDHTLFAAVDS